MREIQSLTLRNTVHDIKQYDIVAAGLHEPLRGGPADVPGSHNRDFFPSHCQASCLFLLFVVLVRGPPCNFKVNGTHEIFAQIKIQLNLFLPVGFGQELVRAIDQLLKCPGLVAA